MRDCPFKVKSTTHTYSILIIFWLEFRGLEIKKNDLGGTKFLTDLQTADRTWYCKPAAKKNDAHGVPFRTSSHFSIWFVSLVEVWKTVLPIDIIERIMPVFVWWNHHHHKVTVPQVATVAIAAMATTESHLRRPQQQPPPPQRRRHRRPRRSRHSTPHANANRRRRRRHRLSNSPNILNLPIGMWLWDGHDKIIIMVCVLFLHCCDRQTFGSIDRSIDRCLYLVAVVAVDIWGLYFLPSFVTHSHSLAVITFAWFTLLRFVSSSWGWLWLFLFFLSHSNMVLLLYYSGQPTVAGIDCGPGATVSSGTVQDSQRCRDFGDLNDGATAISVGRWSGAKKSHHTAVVVYWAWQSQR